MELLPSEFITTGLRLDINLSQVSSQVFAGLFLVAK
jgi:hypothetical protein